MTDMSAVISMYIRSRMLPMVQQRHHFKVSTPRTQFSEADKTKNQMNVALQTKSQRNEVLLITKNRLL